jgi:hypothetical protein
MNVGVSFHLGNLILIPAQGRRNRGGQGQAPKFSKVPFSGSKVPFTSVKNVVQIAFFAQRPLVYDCICLCILVCAEKFCYFRVKLCFARKIFQAFGGKNVISPENFLVCPENFLR